MSTKTCTNVLTNWRKNENLHNFSSTANILKDIKIMRNVKRNVIFIVTPAGKKIFLFQTRLHFTFFAYRNETSKWEFLPLLHEFQTKK